MTDVKVPPAELGAPALGIAPKPLPPSISPGGGTDYGPEGPPTLGIKDKDKEKDKD